jgi:hypothetical protein
LDHDERGDSQQRSPWNEDAIQPSHNQDEHAMLAFLNAATGINGQRAKGPAHQDYHTDHGCENSEHDRGGAFHWLDGAMATAPRQAIEPDLEFGPAYSKPIRARKNALFRAPGFASIARK